MGCAESCNAKDFEAKVATVYLNSTQLFLCESKTFAEGEIKLFLDDDTKPQEMVFTTRLNDIPSSDRNRTLMQSSRISKDAVVKLTGRTKKPSLVLLDADVLVKKVRRHLE